MGNNVNDAEGMNTNEWLEISQPSRNVTLWQNKHNNNFHIEEHKLYTLDTNQLNHQLDLYYRRKNHTRWVAALYFKQKGSEEFCVSRSIAYIYLEKIPIRISDLKDLPNTDAIHAYDQCLQGFGELASIFGCFRVHPEYIGVNQKGVIKVWAGAQWSQLGVIADKITEQNMVKSIIDIVDSYTYDYSDEHPSIKNYLYRKTDALNFHNAIRQLREYANITNGGIIPSKLESLYMNKNFDSFMDPLLRESYHDPNQSMSRNFLPSESIYLSRKEQKDEGIIKSGHQPLTTFRKVEQNRKSYDRVNQSFVVPVKEQKVIEERTRNVQYDQKNRSSVNSSVDYNRSRNSNNVVPTIRINSPRQNHPQEVVISQPARNSGVIINKAQPKAELSPRPTLNFKYPQQNKSLNFAPTIRNQTNTDLRSKSREIQPQNRPAVNFQGDPLFNRPKSINNVSSPPIQISKNTKPITFNRSHQQSLITIPANNRASTPNIPRPVKPSEPSRQKGMPESIIMSLYQSQDRFAGNSQAAAPTKQFGKVKRTESIRQQQKNPGSATVIKSQDSNPMLGVPYQYNSMSSNHLKSIQELSHENSKYEPFAESSNHIRNSSNYSSTSNLVPTNNFISTTGTTNYRTIDPNDGKSSEEMMQFLRSVKNT